MQTELTLTGRPYTKKNSQQITYNRGTGKRGLIQSKQYRTYETDCLWQLKKYKGPTFEGVNLHLQALYYMPNRRGWPDLVGVLQATQDILQKAGIIDNDKNIVSVDGSGVVGVDKDNPRADIFLEEIDDGLSD